MNNNRVTGNKLHGGKQWVTKVKLRDDEEEEAAAAPTLLEFLFYCSCAIVKFYGGSETGKLSGVAVLRISKPYFTQNSKKCSFISIMYVHALTHKAIHIYLYPCKQACGIEEPPIIKFP